MISFTLYGDDVTVRFGGPNFLTYKVWIKSLGFARFNSDAKAWAFPINFFKRVLPLLNHLPETPSFSRDLYDRLIDQRSALARASAIREEKEYDFTPDGFRGRLLGFQKIGAAFLCEGQRAILGDDVGLGKTVQTLAAVAHLYNTAGVESILIICPGHLKRQWEKEVRKFTYLEPIRLEGGRSGRAWQFQNSSASIFITNYELLQRDPEYLGKEWDIVILDEAQEIKTFSTRAARISKRLRAKFKWALTATPLENQLPELHSILEFISPGVLGSWGEFERIYVKRDLFGKIVGYNRLDQLKEIIKPYFLRRRVEDCLTDFTPKETKIARMDFTSGQKMVYNDVGKRVIQFSNEGRALAINSSQRMNQVGYLRQACDDTRLISPELVCPCAKTPWLKALIADIKDRGEKAVIFTEWERMARYIASEIGTDCLLHGKLNFGMRHSILERWEGGDQSLVTTDCSNVGLNLQSANWLINYEMHWNPAVMKQRAGRVWRLTQEKVVHVRAPLINGSIEERVIATLAGKTDLFKTVIDSLASEAVKVSRDDRGT
jgi:SNF2 family DNA or RNA helicase